MVDQIKKELKIDGWVHMPPTSGENQYYRMLRVDYEAEGYRSLGTILFFDRSEASYKLARGYLVKAQIIYNLLGLKIKSEETGSLLASIIDRLAIIYGGGQKCMASMTAASVTNIDNARRSHENSIEMNGSTSEAAVMAGLSYATTLQNAYHSIKAERLATNLVTSSRLVHGPEHSCTRRADQILNQITSRDVNILLNDKLPGDGGFQALRYENDGGICVVKGPIAVPRREDDERIYSVATDLILPIHGCLVICHGLVGAPHLNGKMGDVRGVHTTEPGVV